MEVCSVQRMMSKGRHFGVGFSLGVAFQLVDDLLDFTADKTALGKPIGGDLREGKVTLAAIKLLERCGSGSRADQIVRETVKIDR
ncbi:MAG: hypothetical protein Ct9H300mP25_06650 [Acidobacteriota bacterium]|nr:MAG: hypothetical protein Ct9H300mP25_06650 [Acidobacteriota bacterium]